jgi:amino acid transporter
MRNLIFGVVGVIWGGFMLIGFARKGGPEGHGAYFAGQVFALLLGVLLLGAGLYYLFAGIRSIRNGSWKAKKRKRRPRPGGHQRAD